MRNKDYVDSPYYLGNCDNPPVKITIQTGYQTVSDELPWDTGSDEVVRIVYGLLTTLGFPEIGTLGAMRDFADNKLDYLGPETKDEEENEDLD